MHVNALDTLELMAKKVLAWPFYHKFENQSPLMQRLIVVASLAMYTTVILGFLYYFVNPIVAYGSLASILAGLATGLGSLPALFFNEVKQRTLYIMLGGAAGVMLAATAFSLVVPGIQYGNAIWPGKGIYIVALGMLIGAVFLEVADRMLPHHGPFEDRSELIGSLRKIWLFIIAITVHNFPEGMAVGVSFGSGDWHNGASLAIAIALQNIPEGLAVALPLVGLGYSRKQAVLIGTLSGLVEPIGGFLGVAAVTVFSSLLPFGMAFAAGAMLFVISDDIIPETQSKGKERMATFAVMVGFVIMMILDNMLS
ncbi:ZIP family metal transporter [Methyloterricola oryzae]|uniref:ZIP family metal transporter n=1 Tax=Methyloterricola oryzae TaxID=1495050 RepID=UPI000AAF633D|nr:ZIP family metal transporter [Methyloterricola oryzae]